MRHGIRSGPTRSERDALFVAAFRGILYAASDIRLDEAPDGSSQDEVQVADKIAAIASAVADALTANNAAMLGAVTSGAKKAHQIASATWSEEWRRIYETDPAAALSAWTVRHIEAGIAKRDLAACLTGYLLAQARSLVLVSEIDPRDYDDRAEPVVAALRRHTDRIVVPASVPCTGGANRLRQKKCLCSRHVAGRLIADAAKALGVRPPRGK